MLVQQSTPSSTYSRRSFLRLASEIAIASSLPIVLNACGTNTAGPTTAGTSTGGSPSGSAVGVASGSPSGSGSGLPAYVPAQRPKPDFLSKGALYEDGYINYPAEHPKGVSSPPGLGGNVVAFVQPLQPPPTPLDQNPAWKEVNKQLNVTFQFNLAAPADLQVKLSTLMAGNDLPDFINVFRGINGIANLPPFLQASCADLTPYLGGDAAKEYPFLAAIPTFAWRNSGSVINNHIYMVPIERYAPGALLLKNTNVYDKEIGANYVPKSLDDFRRVLLQLNRPQDGRYAISSYQAVTAAGGAFAVAYFAAAFGAPNSWLVDSTGKFVKDFETPQFKEAVMYARDLVAAGVFHPNTLSNSSIKGQESDFVSGRAVLSVSSFGNPWNDVWRQMRGLRNPTEVMMIPPFPAHEGGKAAHLFGLGFQSATAMKKASPERIKELLRILNYLAAPFGSAEDLLLTSGLNDTDYKLDSAGNPVLTSRGLTDANNVPWKYVIQRPQVMYLPDIPDYAKVMYDAEQQLIPLGVADPSLGLYSPTSTSKGVPVEKALMDALTELMAGRRPVSDYDQLVKDWQNAAGNQIRTELMQANAGAGPS